MKIIAAFVLGVLTGLAFVRIPHYVGPLFQDEPQTPVEHKNKERYWNGGVIVSGQWPTSRDELDAIVYQGIPPRGFA